MSAKKAIPAQGILRLLLIWYSGITLSASQLIATQCSIVTGPLLCRAAGKVSSTAAVGGQWANIYFKRTVDTTAEGLRKLTSITLAVCTSCHRSLLHAMQNCNKLSFKCLYITGSQFNAANELAYVWVEGTP